MRCVVALLTWCWEDLLGTQRHYHEYIEYRCGAVTKTNRGQSVKRYVLPLSEVIPKHVRACFSRNVFDGSELINGNVLEALAKYAECWKEEAIDPAFDLPEVIEQTKPVMPVQFVSAAVLGGTAQ